MLLRKIDLDIETLPRSSLAEIRFKVVIITVRSQLKNTGILQVIKTTAGIQMAEVSHPGVTQQIQMWNGNIATFLSVVICLIFIQLTTMYKRFFNFK